MVIVVPLSFILALVVFCMFSAFFQTKVGKIVGATIVVFIILLVCQFCSDEQESFNTSEYLCYKYEYNEVYDDHNKDGSPYTLVSVDTLEVRINNDSVVVFALAYMNPQIEITLNKNIYNQRLGIDWDLLEIPFENISKNHEDIDTFVLYRRDNFMPNDVYAKSACLKTKDNIYCICFEHDDSCKKALTKFVTAGDTIQIMNN